jgi:hypothetical protein
MQEMVPVIPVQLLLLCAHLDELIKVRQQQEGVAKNDPSSVGTNGAGLNGSDVHSEHKTKKSLPRQKKILYKKNILNEICCIMLLCFQTSGQFHVDPFDVLLAAQHVAAAAFGVEARQRLQREDGLRRFLRRRFVQRRKFGGIAQHSSKKKII